MPHRSEADDNESGPLIWRSLPLRLAMVAIPLWMTTAVLIANVDWRTRVTLALVLGLSLAAPARGLLLTAVLAPLGHLFAPLIGATNFRISEAVVLAFLVGWLLRALPDRRGPGVPAPFAGWLFAATITASIVGLAWQLRGYSGVLSSTIDQLAHAYYFVGDRIGFIDGARLLEGLGLVAATVMLFRRHPALAVTLPQALTASASVAALSSVLLWRGVGSATALERFGRIGYRVSGHVADVNAAGSYFAMIVCLALGMAMRDRGYRRVMWLSVAGATGVGLWLSESRSALAAAGAIMVIAATWTTTSRFSVRARAATLAAIMIAVLGAGAVRVRLLEADRTYRGAGFREQFNATSLRMIGARPLSGVGVGQYYRMSSLFLSPQLAWTYGVENAHNYFLQIGGELGVAGLGLFAIWIGAAVARSARAVARAPRDARLLGASSGVMVFLVTCLTGHPLLIDEVAYPFWIQFGLMTALAASALLDQAAIGDESHVTPVISRTRSLLAAAAAVAILLSVPALTALSPVNPSASQAVDGFYRWEALQDGTRFRWTGAYASLFVPADVSRVSIPVRLPTNGRTIKPMGVEVMTASVDQGRTMVDDTWAIIDIRLPDGDPRTRFKRIDLKVDRTWQPAVYIAGSADLRAVGVQVGELSLLRQ